MNKIRLEWYNGITHTNGWDNWVTNDEVEINKLRDKGEYMRKKYPFNVYFIRENK